MGGVDVLMRDIWSDLNQLRQIFVRKDKFKFVVLFMLMLVAALIDAAGVGAIPAFISVLVNPEVLLKIPVIGESFSGISDKLTVEIMTISSIVLGLFVTFKNLFLSFVYYCQARITMRQWIKLASRMFSAYQGAPYDWYLQRNSSEFLRNIQNDTQQCINGYVQSFLSMLMAILITIFILILLVVTAPGGVLGSFIIMGVGLVFIIRMSQGELRRVGVLLRNGTKEVNQAILQGFGAFVDARVIGCEKYLEEKHYHIMQRIVEGSRKVFVIVKALPLAIETIAVYGLLVVVFLLYQAANSPSEILPAVGLLGMATLRLKQTTSAIGLAIGQMNAARAYIPGIVSDIEELRKLEKNPREGVVKEEKVAPFSVLKLENISYRYPNSDIDVLNQISLELKQGQSIGIVGSTGCGKSTLVSVILGLLQPQQGELTVNQLDVFSNMDVWRSHLGYIPQSVYLLDDTIRSNIAFGVPADEVDEALLWSAIQSANLKRFIVSLPDGVDTEVGENGARLSGGQRQRLGIARALYFNPNVLVLDEATSALDNKTEVEVMKAIQNLKEDRTLIMIAHRLSTVENCDCLYYMEEGAIVAFGTFVELKRKSKAFREMVEGSSFT